MCVKGVGRFFSKPLLFFILTNVIKVKVTKKINKMKRIKKFILALLLTKEQRVVILNALNFSLYTYKRRGQIEEAIQVGVVVSDLQKVLTKPKQTYNEKGSSRNS